MALDPSPDTAPKSCREPKGSPMQTPSRRTSLARIAYPGPNCWRAYSSPKWGRHSCLLGQAFLPALCCETLPVVQGRQECLPTTM